MALPEEPYIRFAGRLSDRERLEALEAATVVMADDSKNCKGDFTSGKKQSEPASVRRLFTAPRVDYSLHRLRHYTGTAPEHFQNFVLFTNYQFYIDEFVRLGHETMSSSARAQDYTAFVEPGNVITRRAGLPAERAREIATFFAASRFMSSVSSGLTQL